MKLDSERLKMLRESHGWSQDQLANAAGVSVRTIQRAESEGTASRETRICLAAALGVPHADLRAKDPDASPASHTRPGMSVSELVHTTLGSTFLLVGLGLLGSSLFSTYSPVMIYLGTFFALGGVLDLVLARFAKRSIRIDSRSVA
jgi:DNA-binding XRE family transcriptional regulator